MNGSSPATGIKRAAILFAGGPAPAANAVISTAAASFLRNGIEVVGIRRGYSALVRYTPATPLQANTDYFTIDSSVLRRTRNTQGVMVGTARTNPGNLVGSSADMDDGAKTEPLRRVYDGLCSIGVDALVSIGGDDTLKTANKLKLYQDRLPRGAKRIPIVHLPKTIDNDYMGIDFTFGYFTAVDFIGSEIRNLIHDAEAGGTYFICETMGRSAGWLAYGAAIAGEASLVISVEDIHDDLQALEHTAEGPRSVMNMERVTDRIVKVMLAREAQGKDFGVIVIGEGLAELLPEQYVSGVARDDHGHLSIADISLGRMFAELVERKYTERTARTRKVTGVQLGYESRCAKPHAFDVMLGAQLGVGAYRALVEKGLNGVMVSVSGQLDLRYVAFEDLIDPHTLVTVVRLITPGSDFHRLARFMETYVSE